MDQMARNLIRKNNDNSLNQDLNNSNSLQKLDRISGLSPDPAAPVIFSETKKERPSQYRPLDLTSQLKELK